MRSAAGALLLFSVGVHHAYSQTSLHQRAPHPRCHTGLHLFSLNRHRNDKSRGFPCYRRAPFLLALGMFLWPVGGRASVLPRHSVAYIKIKYVLRRGQGWKVGIHSKLIVMTGQGMSGILPPGLSRLCMRLGPASPRAMSPRIMSPRFMSPRVMSPRVLSPRVISPRPIVMRWSWLHQLPVRHRLQ